MSTYAKRVTVLWVAVLLFFGLIGGIGGYASGIYIRPTLYLHYHGAIIVGALWMGLWIGGTLFGMVAIQALKWAMKDE